MAEAFIWSETEPRHEDFDLRPPMVTDAEIRAAEAEDEALFRKWWDELGDEERQSVLQLSTGERFHGIAPQEGPQEQAYFSKADVVGYGGAAGGGKSALIVLLALLEHQRTVIYRADKNQMSGMIDDVVQFYGTDVGLNRQSGVFRFTDRPGHMMEWGGLAKPGSEQVWRGRPHDLLCIDEATEIRRDKFEFLKTWCRTTLEGQRTRILLTFNPPGGPGDESGARGRWVVDYFAPWLDERLPPEERAEPGEIRYFVKDEHGKQIQVPNGDPYLLKLGDDEMWVKPESRTFIPARLSDNLYLDRDENYRSRLAAMDEPYRTMMLKGEFRSGIVDADYQVLLTAWIDEAMERWEKLYGAGGEGRDFGIMHAMGIDVARGGRHQTVYARRHDFHWRRLKRLPGHVTQNGAQVGGPALSYVRNNAGICIDKNGVGSSPFDWLEERWPNVWGILDQAGARDLQRYERGRKLANMRAALWWVARKVFDPENECKPALPPDDKLRSELISMRYKFAGGRLAMMDKDDVAEDLGFHPDDADAVVYSLRNVRNSPSAYKLLRGKHNAGRGGEGQPRRKPRYATRRSGGTWMGH